MLNKIKILTVIGIIVAGLAFNLNKLANSDRTSFLNLAKLGIVNTASAESYGYYSDMYSYESSGRGYDCEMGMEEICDVVIVDYYEDYHSDGTTTTYHRGQDVYESNCYLTGYNC